MITLQLEKQKFPSGQNGIKTVSFDDEDLIRAAIGAGSDWRIRNITAAEQADIEMRVNCVRSMIDTTSGTLQITPQYKALGSTHKANKSFYMGNTVCALIAMKELKVPWIADVEALDNVNYPTYRYVNRRPDFIGPGPTGQWYVFESKGRSLRPWHKILLEWKSQANAISHVNGVNVTYNIVSVSYFNRFDIVEALWIDPPNGDDNSPESNITFPNFSFFAAYYRGIHAMLRNGVQELSTDLGRLFYFPRMNIYLGLHRDVLTAFERQDSAAIEEFALRFISEELPPLSIEDPKIRLFPDGLLIKVNGNGSQPERVTGVVPGAHTEVTMQGTHKEFHTAESSVGQTERATQNRIIALFRDELGYRYVGDWTDREGNSNIEEGLFSAYLTKCGYTPAQINVATHKLRIEADNHNRGLYGNNQAVYNLLRYGVPVKIEAGKVTETVHLVNWRYPDKNDFVIVQEVTLKGIRERRPDLVLYVNGIAVGVLELKNSRVSIGDGIRQNLSNQQPEFNEWFFSTVQLIFAGNDSEGLQYGTIGTPEKYFLKWKEDEADDSRFKLDKYLIKMCRKDRLIELMHDFVLFDGGVKKLPRVHQYFGIKAAQKHVSGSKGGIIWHTQGSGKSIVMVFLAKWILENNPNARVAIITDRDELDKQIERVFTEAGEAIKRTNSGRNLMTQLGQAKPRLLCSLIHKFGRKDVDDFDAFIRELEAQPSPTVGEVFVFVDECHRTQSGKLHRVMKAIMPNAVFIGFTGTPLLKKDMQTSLEVFGGYIHTYKFSEGVEDGVVLDLVYEARDIDQRLGSEDKIDAWFEAKTRGLNDWQKDELKKRWGTMQNVLSSKSRMDRVVSDIIFDFSVKPRLSSERGNAILVASSIYEACKYFTLFQKTPFKDKCAVVTSYNPNAQDVTKEEVGANTETDKQFIYNAYSKLLNDVDAKPGMTKTETYEERAKDLFIKEPANMKMLVVVDKLLTGFDAPPCTYLYIDKSMQDHGLFQAICRTNRLDGEDKDFGYIVDYKDLFKKVENAIAVYTSELDHSAGGAAPEVLLQDRLKKGRERVDNAIEMLSLMCEPVEPPRGELEHIHYFCGNTEIPTDLQEREPQRAALYKATVAMVRAYANIADELEPAGYSTTDIARIKQQRDHYLKVREIIRKASGESLDLKAYEADMRHLIDTYIEADEPRKISPFDGMSLLDLIVKTGIADAIATQLGGLKGNKNAISETIENNVRRKIIKEHLNDPAYYEKMSALLEEIIADRKAKAIEYEEYLKRIAELAKKVEAGKAEDTPETLDTPGKRALYNNLKKDGEMPRGADSVAEDLSEYGSTGDPVLNLALTIDETVKKVRPDGWRGVQAREQVIKAALYGILQDVAEVERVFLIIKAQKEY